MNFKQTWTPRVDRARHQAVICYARVKSVIPMNFDKVDFGVAYKTM